MGANLPIGTEARQFVSSLSLPFFSSRGEQRDLSLSIRRLTTFSPNSHSISVSMLFLGAFTLGVADEASHRTH